jgi:hypothetical protein
MTSLSDLEVPDAPRVVQLCPPSVIMAHGLSSIYSATH